jgi:phosphoribosyl-ATP pyrophosphohydrolase|tara:strand:- start:225 stop:515 length:291 start_codon:yes stop_codon:yes gene_type:complete
MQDNTEIINELWEIIKKREKCGDENSYTYSTLKKGIKKASQKVGEEAAELIVASLAETKKEIINESADLIFHWLLLLKLTNVDPNEVFQELKNRRN